MAKLIGSAPNQISTNGDLGSMAFEDKKNYATTSSPIYQPYRNIIINGDMSIAQRGTSASGLTGSGYNTIDRFSLFNTGLGTWTQSQSTDVPSGQGFAKSMKMDCTTDDASPASGDLLQLRTAFEGQNLQYLNFGTSSAKSLTLSFWVKSNKTGTYTMVFFHRDASKMFSKSYTISSANTWEKKTITVIGNTADGIDNDNARSFDVFFNLGAGSNFTSGSLSSGWEADTDANYAVGQVNLADSTSNEWYITGVQLEAGTTASDFEFLPYDVNLRRCQRYYQNVVRTEQDIPVCMASSWSTTTAYGIFPLYTTMRATPSLDQVTGSSYYRYYNAFDSSDYFDSFELFIGTPNIVNLRNADSMTITSGQSGWFVLLNANAYLAFDAEL